jgi:hypothetical protein
MSKNTQQGTPPNVLFFSKKCKTCNVFMTMCQQNKILKYFQLIDVDDKIKELSEKGLKVVPTIIVKGLSKPIEGKNVLIWVESVISMNANKRIDVSGDTYLPEINIPNNPYISNGGQINQSAPTNGAGTINPNNNVVKRNLVVAPPIINPKQASQNQQNQNNQQNEGNRPAVKMINGVEIKSNNNCPSVRTQPFGFLQDEMSGFSDSFAYLMTDDPLPKAFLPYDKDLQIYTAPEGDVPDVKQLDLLMKNVEMIRENDKKSFVKNMENEHAKILSNGKDRQ